MKGPQGSGKSTFAKEFLQDRNYVRIGNDDLRIMLCNRVFDEGDTEFIKKVALWLLEDILVYTEKSVIMDNMNITSDEDIKDVVDKSKQDAQVSIIQMDTPLEDCLERNSKRPSPVPPEVIKSMYGVASGTEKMTDEVERLVSE